MTTRSLTLLIGLLGMGGLCGACGGDDPPDPLATQGGFCLEWAKRACNDEVVEVCAATGPEACQQKQQEHCRSLVPLEAYRREDARACLDAVRSALSDARLTSEEVGVVLRGEGPCSFRCVEVSDGSCVTPAVVGGGEQCSSEGTICADGYYCDGDNCLVERSLGQACNAAVPCRSTLKCVGEAGAQVCQAKATNGSPCEAQEDCQSGICAEGAGLCVAQITLSAAEGTCTLFR